MRAGCNSMLSLHFRDSMDNQSKYDPSRKTVGAIYRDAQLNNTEDKIQVGDITRELTSSLVSDLNDAIKNDPFDGLNFYITVHESRDLQMKNMFKRRMIFSKYRPYSEDDTVVFWVDPKSCQVKFCWCLPHWSEMDNALNNAWMWETTEWGKEFLEEIRAWKRVDLHHFGFKKDELGNWTANEHWIDRPMSDEPDKVQILTV